MAPLANRLATTWRTVVVDLPGHGFSPAPPSAWGVEQHVELVEKLAKELGIGRCALVGHSNGGRISLRLASDPKNTLKPAFLALISPSGVPRTRTLTYYVKVWTAKILKAPFSILPGPLKAFCLDWLRHSLVWRLLGSSDYRSLSGVMKDTFVKTVNHYVVDGLANISCPVLLLWGSRDEAITRKQMDTLVQNIPDAGLMVLENAGHYGYLDQPDTVVSAIQSMAESIAASDSSRKEARTQ